MSHLIASIAEREASLMMASARMALAGGADLVELRLDRLLTPAGQALVEASALPTGRWIATARSAREGGDATLSTSEVCGLLRAAADAGATIVDVESARLAEADSGRSLREWLDRESRVTPIVSTHFVTGRPADAPGLVERTLDVSPRAIAKLAWVAEELTESLEVLDLVRANAHRVIGIAMGEKGLLSRVLARKAGAFGTFCAPAAASATAPGQPTLGDMVDLYRWPQHTAGTQLFGVIGSPVAHSLSPAVFNSLFARDEVDAVYLPLRADTAGELTRFLDGCRARPWLNVRGFSITVPHKQAALDWAAEGADLLARRIGAANTLTFADGRVTATNTDLGGALQAIRVGLRVDDAGLGRLRVAVLGAGGAARAVVAGLSDAGCAVTVYNRSAQRSRQLADDLGCAARPWDDRGHIDVDLVVNCTSVGLWPNVAETPLPAEALAGRPAVFDTIYRPLETRLLREARQAGCTTISGVDMFVHQAAAQYTVWTGRSPDLGWMRRLVCDRLSEGTEAEQP